MAGISRYEKVTLALTAAFLLFTGGWFLAGQGDSAPYEVTVAQRVEEASASVPAAQSVQDGTPDSLLEGEVIDLNTADVYELQRLPGIGEKRAQAIVAYREAHGPFPSVEALTQVDGIGEGILAGLSEFAVAGGTGN